MSWMKDFSPDDGSQNGGCTDVQIYFILDFISLTRGRLSNFSFNLPISGEHFVQEWD